MREAYPGRSRASFPWRSPATATPATAGRQAGGRWQLGPCSPQFPPRPHSRSILGVVRNIRRLPCPPPIRSPATEKLSLAFPVLMPLKSLGCGQGRRAGELTLKGVSAAWSQG